MEINMGKLNVSNLTCYRSGNEIFKNISFSLDDGQICLLTGANGSGKTTLLRVLAGLTPSSSGFIEYNNLSSLNDNFYILGHKLGIKDEITPYEDLLFWSSLYEYKNFEDTLKRFDLFNSKSLKCKYLSQGQKQRLAISRLSISKKPIWLLDEPISSLDKQGISLLKDLINKHIYLGGIAIISSHIDFLKKYDFRIDMDK
tara:strand:- start:3219 stop:3818 length:600 start_codon:yes stop_codon:yes gene_type:complete